MERAGPLGRARGETPERGKADCHTSAVSYPADAQMKFPNTTRDANAAALRRTTSADNWRSSRGAPDAHPHTHARAHQKIFFFKKKKRNIASGPCERTCRSFRLRQCRVRCPESTISGQIPIRGMRKCIQQEGSRAAKNVTVTLRLTYAPRALAATQFSCTF